MFCQSWKVTGGGGDIVQTSHNSHDLPSVLITYIFGNNLIKTSFEAKGIRSNWKLKTAFFQDFWLYVQAMSSYYNSTAFYRKLTGTDLGCFSNEG